jgi:cbb3-type cytochrome oxidase subunit 3
MSTFDIVISGLLTGAIITLPILGEVAWLYRLAQQERKDEPIFYLAILVLFGTIALIVFFLLTLTSLLWPNTTP